MKLHMSSMGLSNREGQSCWEVPRNEIVKPTRDSLVPVTVLHPSQRSTAITLGREQGPRLGCCEQGLDLSLGGCFSNEHPTREKGRLSCSGHLRLCSVLVVHARVFFVLFCYSLAPFNLMGMFPLVLFPENNHYIKVSLFLWCRAVLWIPQSAGSSLTS